MDTLTIQLPFISELSVRAANLHYNIKLEDFNESEKFPFSFDVMVNVAGLLQHVADHTAGGFRQSSLRFNWEVSVRTLLQFTTDVREATYKRLHSLAFV